MEEETEAWRKWPSDVFFFNVILLSSLSSGPGFFTLWSFGRSNKQTGSSSKKAADIVNLKMLELTGDLIGHSGAVQVCFFNVCRTQSRCHNSVLNQLFCLLLTPDVFELWGKRFGHVLGGPPADPVEERRKAVPPAQPGTFPKTRGERRTLTRWLTPVT